MINPSVVIIDQFGSVVNFLFLLFKARIINTKCSGSAAVLSESPKLAGDKLPSSPHRVACANVLHATCSITLSNQRGA